eukprot:3933742-Rhodomonas_salina.1
MLSVRFGVLFKRLFNSSVLNGLDAVYGPTIRLVSFGSRKDANDVVTTVVWLFVDLSRIAFRHARLFNGVSASIESGGRGGRQTTMRLSSENSEANLVDLVSSYLMFRPLENGVEQGVVGFNVSIPCASMADGLALQVFVNCWNRVLCRDGSVNIPDVVVEGERRMNLFSVGKRVGMPGGGTTTVIPLVRCDKLSDFVGGLKEDPSDTKIVIENTQSGRLLDFAC